MSTTEEPRDELAGDSGPAPHEGTASPGPRRGDAQPAPAAPAESAPLPTLPSSVETPSAAVLLGVTVLVCTSLLLAVAIAASAFRYAWGHDSGTVGLNVFAYGEVFGMAALLYAGFVLLAGLGRNRAGVTAADGVMGCSLLLLIPVAVIGLGLPRLLGPVAEWGEALARWAL
ncbi:hypothetical protein OG568_13100 [Streptomyces sp. NBC_01450]|uniref:hypothetical protein n=1 Tax=Streptomyces sp. NBC_01450 TaxID=2903871 RepID=UPI002E2FD885|nr:hypothetical protein [Streptomyces sp. NBC_01450]